MSTMEINETTPVGAPGAESSRVDAEVEAYVGLVRAALRDLPAEDVEDLTGGLEADLSELAAESEEPLIARLGEPSAYAAELRAAAGFPPPGPPPAEPKESWWRRTQQSWSARWEGWRAEHPWLEKARPIWWVTRGAVLALFAFAVLGAGVNLPLMILGAGLSFWVGLLQDGWVDWRRTLVRVANVAAAVLLLPALVAVADRGGSAAGPVEDIDSVPSQGTFVDGESPAGFFVYDGDGQRVEGARIFTDQGNAVTVNPWDYWDGEGDEPRSSRVDTFPITLGDLDGWSGWTVDYGQGTWTPPMAIPPAFPIDPSQRSTAEPTEEPTGAATDEPTAPTDDPADDAAEDAEAESAENPTAEATATATGTP